MSAASTPELYRDHLRALEAILAEALERCGAEAALFHSGEERTYHADDQPIPFRPAAHFARFVPLDGPGHFVLARPGRKPRVFHHAPVDFWFEHRSPEPSYWQGEVDLEEFADLDELSRRLGPLAGTAYVGPDPGVARRLGIDPSLVEPAPLLARLDWYRAVKTPHEVALIRAAARRAAAGHRAAREAFLEGRSEREIHWAYLRASGHLERELPFEPIAALDDKAAILHYQNKRASGSGRVLLMDAGAACDGYASDITRTWTAAGVEPLFAELLRRLDAAQRELVAMVRPGRPYPEIHSAALEAVAKLLAETGLVRECDLEVARVFLPHGVGHHLGLQVHDVGGRQAGPDGGTAPPPPADPFLRNTRTLEAGHVVTIEPGIYFIPSLLERLRRERPGAPVDWAAVERLRPCGGIRIEDDVLCTDGGPDDLTRPLLPQCEADPAG